MHFDDLKGKKNVRILLYDLIYEQTLWMEEYNFFTIYYLYQQITYKH